MAGKYLGFWVNQKVNRDEGIKSSIEIVRYTFFKIKNFAY